MQPVFGQVFGTCTQRWQALTLARYQYRHVVAHSSSQFTMYMCFLLAAPHRDLCNSRPNRSHLECVASMESGDPREHVWGEGVHQTFPLTAFCGSVSSHSWAVAARCAALSAASCDVLGMSSKILTPDWRWTWQCFAGCYRDDAAT